MSLDFILVIAEALINFVSLKRKNKLSISNAPKESAVFFKRGEKSTKTVALIKVLEEFKEKYPTYWYTEYRELSAQLKWIFPSTHISIWKGFD